MPRNWTFAVVVTLFPLLAGCGAGKGTNPPRASVTGKILIGKEPAPAGVITFVPAAAGQLQAQGIVGEDGTFAIAEADGPSPGEYKVQIECYKKTGRRIKSMSSSEPDGMIDERIPVAPAKYNVNTTLMKTITAGKNEFTFELDAK